MLRSAFSTLLNVSLAVGSEHAIIQLDNRPEPVKLQWLVSTLPQDSPIRDGKC